MNIPHFYRKNFAAIAAEKRALAEAVDAMEKAGNSVSSLRTQLQIAVEAFDRAHASARVAAADLRLRGDVAVLGGDENAGRALLVEAELVEVKAAAASASRGDAVLVASLRRLIVEAEAAVVVARLEVSAAMSRQAALEQAEEAKYVASLPIDQAARLICVKANANEEARAVGKPEPWLSIAPGSAPAGGWARAAV